MGYEIAPFVDDFWIGTMNMAGYICPMGMQIAMGR